MVTDGQIEDLCNQLQNSGSVVIDQDGHKLAFISSDIMTFAGPAPDPTILVAWEGKGAFFWRVGSPMNTFLLIEAGFTLRVAPTLADILNRVGNCLMASPGWDDVGSGTLLLGKPEG